MSDQRPAVCPRCQRLFACRTGTIDQCQCRAVQLTAEQRQYVAAHYAGCLCADCLLALRTEHNAQLQ